MSRGAYVASIAALTEFRADLAGFVAEAREALSANEMELQRAFTWLETQTDFWKRQIRVRQEEVVTAKNNLAARKMLKLFDRPPDCTEQEKALRLAQRRLAEAEQKLANCKRWTTELPRHADEYQAKARRMSGILEADLPRAGSMLERKIESLEAYANMAPPLTPPLPGDSAPPMED
jgi:hypothetical protein